MTEKDDHAPAETEAGTTKQQDVASAPTSPEKRKRSGKTENDGETQDQQTDGDSKNVTPKTKKPKKDVPVVDLASLHERRERKPVQHYTVEAPAKKAVVVEVPEGKGTPLKDIKKIADKALKMPSDDDIFVGLSALIFGRAGRAKNAKREVMKFKGFDFSSDKEHDLALDKLARWTTLGLKELASLLCLESSGTKDVIIDRVFQFLQEPSASAIKDGRRKAGSKTPTKSKTTEKLTAFDIFSNEKHAEAKKHVTSEDADEEDEIDAKLQEMYDELDEAGKKQYEEKAEAANTKAAKKSPAKTPKAAPKTPKTPKSEKVTKTSKTPKTPKTPKNGKKSKAPAKSAETVDDSAESNADTPAKDDSADDDKPLAPKTAGKTSPSNADIVSAIKKILTPDNLGELSNKRVRAKLEEQFGCDMNDRKPFIKEVIDKTIAEMQQQD
ncbi:hypothetical protein HDU89_000258 [Geranomyces variabilis]|nr:hypothetical protein HDU89_000258 [Geranomyces variabilis]